MLGVINLEDTKSKLVFGCFGSSRGGGINDQNSLYGNAQQLISTDYGLEFPIIVKKQALRVVTNTFNGTSKFNFWSDSDSNIGRINVSSGQTGEFSNTEEQNIINEDIGFFMQSTGLTGSINYQQIEVLEVNE